MGFRLKEEITSNDQHSIKKKSKKKYRDHDSEGDEVLNNTPKNNKLKKRQTTIYPKASSEDEIEENSISKMDSNPMVISNDLPSDSELQVAKKNKKKKKSRDRESLLKREQVEDHFSGDEAHDIPVEEQSLIEELAILDGETENVIPPEIEEDFYDGWSKEDLKELFVRMEQAIPKNDSFKATSRLQKLNWDKIKFNSYTAADCQEKWKYVEKKVRGFRLLGELLSDANTWLEKPWTDFYRSERKNRHPGMPKRPLTSFMLFYMDKKKKFAKKYPNLEMSKLSKIMAEKFHTLSENKREKYKKLAIVMREEYNEKMQKFLEEHPVEALQMKKSVKTKKEKTTISGPKKPITPFKMFYQEKVNRLKEEGVPIPVELLSECKEKWKDMSNRKKIPWIRWAHEAEVKYLEEIKLYTTENPNFEAPPFKSVLSKAEKEILDRGEGKPEKPPNSAYSLFSRLMLKDPGIKERFDTPKQRLQEIARLWKEVPKIEREEYAEKVKHLLENYKLEYASYLESLPEDKREKELASNVPKKKNKPEGATLPKKKFKQTTLNLSSIKSASDLSIVDKDKRKKVYTEQELITMEPLEPPTEAYILFRDEYLKKGLSEKKATKSWEVLSDFEKRKYEQKLASVKQEYITNYRTFLKSLKPEELKLYSQIKEKKYSKELPSEDEEEEEDPEVEQEEADSSPESMEFESEESI